MLPRLVDIAKDHTVRLAETVDAEAKAWRETRSSWAIHGRVGAVVLGAIVCLLIIRFLGNADDVDRLLGLMRGLGMDDWAGTLEHALTKHPDRRIYVRIFWCVSRLVAYGVIPALMVKLLFRERLRDYGMDARTAIRHWRTYLLFLAVVLPFVVAVSFDPAFQAKYPYYRAAKGEPFYPNGLAWELLYGSQFIALELFFRGFLIHGLRPAMGYASVFVPLMPYVMIHYGKPLPEAIGSVITGFVLGTISLKTRSIWGGAAIHILVAWSMDFLSLWHRGLLFR